MWVITYDGERAINLGKVRALKLEPRNGEVLLLAEFGCASDREVLAHGEPNAMYQLLEALVHNHKGPNRAGVFDIAKWAFNRRLVEALSPTPAEAEGVRP